MLISVWPFVLFILAKRAQRRVVLCCCLHIYYPNDIVFSLYVCIRRNETTMRVNAEMLVQFAYMPKYIDEE